MDDDKRTKKQLIEECNALRKCIAVFKNFEEKIKQTSMSQEKFTKAFLQNSVPVCITTLQEGKFVDVSNVFLSLSGFKRDEVIGHTSLEIGFITEKQRASFFNELNKKGRIENLEMEVRTKGGALKQGLFNAVMMSFDNEKFLLTAMTDITERKRMEKALRDSEEHYRLIAENTSDVIWLMDVASGRFIYVSPSVERLRGFRAEELQGQEVRNVLMAESHNLVSEVLPSRITKFQAGDESMRITTRELDQLRKDGSIVSSEMVTTLIADEKGQVTMILGVNRDITERKRVEKELERHRQHLEDMVQERTAELESKNMTLQELNAALKVLLKQREDDKKEMKERFVMNVRNLVVPYVEQMKKGRLDAGQRSFLDNIEQNLHEIATPLLKNIRQYNLTPKEIKVAALVRQGKSTKEIAELLGTASGSVDVHRKNIREKLGLNNRKANLLSHLESLEQ